MSRVTNAKHFKSTCTLYFNYDSGYISDDKSDVDGLKYKDGFSFKKKGTKFYLEQDGDKWIMRSLASNDFYVVFDSLKEAEGNSWFVRI